MVLDLQLSDGQSLFLEADKAHWIQKDCNVFCHPLLSVEGIAIVAGELRTVVGLSPQAFLSETFFLFTEEKVYALSRLPRFHDSTAEIQGTIAA
jgi:hypothetical protein